MTWLHYFWHNYILSIESLKLVTSTFLCFSRTTSVLYWQFDSTLKKLAGALTFIYGALLKHFNRTYTCSQNTLIEKSFPILEK